MRSGATSAVPKPSATFVTSFMPTHRPEKRDIATACIPRSRISWGLPGNSTGICASASAVSLADGIVDDFETGSSPASTSTPPLGATPMRLPCLKTSPQRSTPGALPYQMPTTPSRPSRSPSRLCWLPQTAVAASSSFTPGTRWTSWPAMSAASRVTARSRPPSGEPG